jgi:hypothetical protein
MGFSLYMTCLFFFAAFRIFSLFSLLSVWIMMCLGCFSFGAVSLVFCKLPAPGCLSFVRLVEFSAIILLNRLSMSFVCASSL